MCALQYPHDGRRRTTSERLSWLQPAICEYIEEEAGHEQWILNDLKACGVDPEIVKIAARASQSN